MYRALIGGLLPCASCSVVGLRRWAGVSHVCVPSMVSCSSFGLHMHAQPLRLFVTLFPYFEVVVSSMRQPTNYLHGLCKSSDSILTTGSVEYEIAPLYASMPVGYKQTRGRGMCCPGVFLASLPAPIPMCFVPAFMRTQVFLTRATSPYPTLQYVIKRRDGYACRGNHTLPVDTNKRMGANPSNRPSAASPLMSTGLLPDKPHASTVYWNCFLAWSFSPDTARQRYQCDL